MLRSSKTVTFSRSVPFYFLRVIMSFFLRRRGKAVLMTVLHQRLPNVICDIIFKELLQILSAS